MKLLFILDPLDSLKPDKDTSLAIMRAAIQRGHAVFVCQPHAIFLRHTTVHVHAQPFAFADGTPWYSVGAPVACHPRDFDAVLMRKDPPFDNEYLYSTYLLELATQQGALVLNHPGAIRSWNEKLAATRFPQFTPALIVTSQYALILDFLAEHGDIILKPLDGMGGSGVFRLTQHDPNLGAILETATQLEQRTVMAQRYLPAIAQGDKRIILIHGEPLPYALARIPKAGETRGNLAAGGTGVAQALSAQDLLIAHTIGPVLRQHGLFLVGLDVIGDHLTEINVTSPTGMVEIATQTDCQPAQIFIQALEALP